MLTVDAEAVWRDRLIILPTFHPVEYIEVRLLIEILRYECSRTVLLLVYSDCIDTSRQYSAEDSAGGHLQLHTEQTILMTSIFR